LLDIASLVCQLWGKAVLFLGANRRREIAGSCAQQRDNVDANRVDFWRTREELYGKTLYRSVEPGFTAFQ